jgi:hypothetical protein
MFCVAPLEGIFLSAQTQTDEHRPAGDALKPKIMKLLE